MDLIKDYLDAKKLEITSDLDRIEIATRNSRRI